MMARQVVNPEKLVEAQEAADAAVEAADAAMEAAKLAAEKVAEVRSGDDLTAGQVVNLEKPAKAPPPPDGGQADGGGMADGYRIIQDGPENFSVEGFFRQNGSQRFRSAKGFPSEVAARQWVYDQLAAEDR
jgi:hypothetical protein